MIFGILLGVVGVAAGYVGYVVFCAWYEVRYAPRVPMFMCSKHGPMRKENTIKFAIPGGEPIDYCSLCFHERLKEAEKLGL